MSLAYKCDRCGKLYEAKERTLDFKEYTVLKPHIINYEAGNPGTYLSHVADLCPKCQKQLEEWMTLWKSKEEKSKNLCDSCINKECIFQYGIIRNHCDIYKAENENEYVR